MDGSYGRLEVTLIIVYLSPSSLPPLQSFLIHCQSRVNLTMSRSRRLIATQIGRNAFY